MFDLLTSRDFYAMLVEDFDAFMEAPHSTRHALHCAIIAYHLHEWVWGDWLKRDSATQKALQISDSTSFLKWIENRCPWFVKIQDLTNGTKHFVRNQRFETMRVQAVPFAFDQPFAGLDEGAWDGPIHLSESQDGKGPNASGYLLIDNGEGAAEHRWLPVACLLEVAVRFWRDFFRAYRPAPDLPMSKYHADN